MIIKQADIRDQLHLIRTTGLSSGKSTGWNNLDEYYRPEPGYLTILTGVPGHGKSEWWDCLMVNMTCLHEYRWVVFSPENFPVATHWIKLAEKFLGQKYTEVADSEIKMVDAMIDEYFTWIYPKEEDCSLESILDQVKRVKEVYSADGFVLDPWNEIDHKRPPSLSETEYISQSLTRLRRFCRENNMLGCVVAHPAKLRKTEDGLYPIPTPYDISGSAHWRNKADFCITVHREDVTKNEPMVHVQKVRQKNHGKVGSVQLYYDYRSGLMKDSVHGKYGLPKAEHS